MLQKIIDIVRETDRIFFDDRLRRDVTEKGESDYVTRADIEISEHISRRLAECFPSAEFVSEEGNTNVPERGECFILDPIDGTTNFMYGMKLSAVSLAYCVDRVPIIGVIYQPDTKDIYWAERGKGACLNGKTIKCTSPKRLSESLALYEYNPYFKAEHEIATAQGQKLYRFCRDIRTLGSAALELAYVAEGRADLFMGRYLKPWDYAAALVIITEAGGRVSGIDGEVDLSLARQHILASASPIHEEFLGLMAE